MSQNDLIWHEYAKFYEIGQHPYLDITAKILQSPFVLEKEKQSIHLNGRKIIVFAYPSGLYKVKGLISYTHHVNQNPTLLYLRGGNRFYALQNPGSDLMTAVPYTVLSTTYRGSVSEGADQFGGDDVDDVKNLIDFIPQLEKMLHIELSPTPMTLLGASRGGMQMFLALSRYPELQSCFNRIISLCGMLDLRQTFMTRPDVVQVFKDDFGLTLKNQEEWINHRNPILAASKIDKSLPIYIFQAANDTRVNLQQGYNMKAELERLGFQVHYQEIPNADHCLSNIDNRVDLILKTR